MAGTTPVYGALGQNPIKIYMAFLIIALARDPFCDYATTRVRVRAQSVEWSASWIFSSSHLPCNFLGFFDFFRNFSKFSKKCKILQNFSKFRKISKKVKKTQKSQKTPKNPKNLKNREMAPTGRRGAGGRGPPLTPLTPRNPRNPLTPRNPRNPLTPENPLTPRNPRKPPEIDKTSKTSPTPVTNFSGSPKEPREFSEDLGSNREGPQTACTKPFKASCPSSGDPPTVQGLTENILTLGGGRKRLRSNIEKKLRLGQGPTKAQNPCMRAMHAVHACGFGPLGPLRTGPGRAISPSRTGPGGPLYPPPYPLVPP